MQIGGLGIPFLAFTSLKKTRMHQQMYNMGLLRKDTLAIKYKPRDINHFLM